MEGKNVIACDAHDSEAESTQKRRGTPCGRTNILPCVPEFDLLPTMPYIEPSESIKQENDQLLT